jgi:hypothetical protein
MIIFRNLYIHNGDLYIFTGFNHLIKILRLMSDYLHRVLDSLDTVLERLAMLQQLPHLEQIDRLPKLQINKQIKY